LSGTEANFEAAENTDVEVRSGRQARRLLAVAASFRAQGEAALDASTQSRQAARQAYEAACDEVVTRQLEAMPIARLRETTQGGVRLTAIEAAGFSNVGDILHATPHQFVRIRGVGPESAVQVVAAARQLARVMKDGLWLRFELDRRPAQQGQLLEALATYEAVERVVAPVREDLEPLVASLQDLEQKAKQASSRVRLLLSRRETREEAREALWRLNALVEASQTRDLLQRLEAGRVEGLTEPDAIWADYEERVAAFNGLLVEISGLSPDHDATQGFIPEELARRVHEHPLDTSLLKLSLRGYQAFGAKFALLQRQAMLGDEMGLGKTIEALAAICHLQAQGATHFMVVCPASVLVNWIHEVERHTELAAMRLHGSDRESSFRTWLRRGGVGVTTFQSLRWLSGHHVATRPAMLVVDEAHYVKNPTARRTIAVQRFIQRAERTLFLTGTPMENRVEEFRTLVHHLQPSLEQKVSAVDGLAGAAAFRSAVAPAYLRRNQMDVLQELPPRIETEEWVELVSEDLVAYRDAVAQGNFMAMRQAAYAPASAYGAAKIARLIDLVEEATSNDRKLVIFSFFRAVLEAIADVLDGVAMGPLTGSVPPTRRQQLVDDFTSARRARALVSQIEAGGVGLNIQAASVVILAEPQWKPSVEEQAIGRAHRMGQARPVDVHRLLAEDSVDQRMLEILATKAALFDEYVRKSALKDISPDAVDISNLDATEQVVSQTEEERRIIEIERQRLGLEDAIAAQ
jgi:SNF2 family DNA or RNA helicase